MKIDCKTYDYFCLLFAGNMIKSFDLVKIKNKVMQFRYHTFHLRPTLEAWLRYIGNQKQVKLGSW